MIRVYFILFIVALAAIGYLAVLNPGSVVITLAKNQIYEVLIIGVIVFSAVSGALFVFFGVMIKDTSRYFLGWHATRKEKQKTKVQELYSKGMDALFGRKFAQADTLFEKILVLDPNHVQSLLKLGNNHRRRGNHSEAIRLHQKARNLDDRNIEILFALEADFEEANRIDEAVATLDAILDIDQSNLAALIRKRDMAQRQKQWEKVLDVQEQIVKGPLPLEDKPIEHRRLLGLRYEYGRALLEEGGKEDAEKAKKAFRAIIKADKDFVPASLGLGEIYITEDHTEEAEALWVKAFKTTGSIIFLNRLEDFYLRLSEPEKIIRLYQEAIGREPDNTPLKFFLGKLFHRLEMLDDAFEILSSIDASVAPLPQVHMILGDIYQRRGNMTQATAEFKQALQFRDHIIVPYTCSNCSHSDTNWSGRCPRCERWSTYEVNIHS